ncbi:MAG TPA: aspartyl/asparaginyl beta-hydroxylase domain-containing protein [Allosphingosinicella sp.]
MADDPDTEGSIEADADRAAARGDAAEARAILERVVAAEPDRADAWLKLAAMCRMLNDPEAALSAVSGALRIDPLAFLPLLLKANLLDAVGRPAEAGETYGHALAQRPAQVPPGMAAAIALAEKRHAEHLEAGESRLEAALAPLRSALSEDEYLRARRFNTNILRTTRPFHSEPSHFHYPGLREREFHDRAPFPWFATLESATASVREDFQRVMAAERAELVPYIDYPDDVPLRQWAALNRSSDWTAIHLVRNGVRVEANARHCPTVMDLLGGLDQPEVAGRSPNAMFSLLAPGAHIPPHNGVANSRLVCHLPLIVPPGCWFRVGAERRDWRVGQAWIFDDTIEHEAMNTSDALRVILIVDTWHPDLSRAERLAVAASMEASSAETGEGL